MQSRIRLVLLLVVAGFFFILVRLFYWQVLKRGYLSDFAAKQYHFGQRLSSDRGKILSSDSFPLVKNRQSYSLFVDPSRLKISGTELLEKLKGYLNGRRVDEKKLSNKKIYWVLLAEGLGKQQKEEIENLNVEGLGFDIKSVREYPEGSISAQLLGFVGKDKNGEEKGYFGLEGFYDKEIKGKPGRYFFEADALGRPLPLVKILEEKPVAGRTLRLHLDRRLQFLVENRLKKSLEKYLALSGTVLIMNPKNGAVLAMASLPSFDPADYYSFDQETFRNPAISSIFEPGSIFKVIMMASAIDAGAVTADEVCRLCSGPRKIADYTIKTWNDKYYPNSTMSEVIVNSDNIGMVYVAEKLGTKKLHEYMKKFSLDRQTNIDLQGEINVNWLTQKQWREIDLATSSFGQGIALTPIQVLTAVNAIANGGVIYEPQVVDSVIDGKEEIPVRPVSRGRAISAKSAQIVTGMMVQAVEKGEAKWVKPKGYTVAGKTGTAQIPIAGHYDPEKTVASFVGFAPADDPLFTMLVILNEPRSSPWGSETAAPLWFEIAGDIFRLRGISPEAER